MINKFLISIVVAAGLCAQQIQFLNLKWDCQDCHAPTGWSPLSETMKFDHERETIFPLEGAHRQTACGQCHLGKDVESKHDFKRAPVTCSGCHADLHRGRYGVDCARCHRTSTWDMSYWEDRHLETLFPLVGAHRGRACSDCHANGNYRIDTECANCHAMDFDATNSNHDGLTERSDCSLCHGPTNWQDIMALNHDRVFPINSGRHFGAWNGCNDCHQTAGNYQVYTCTTAGCHSLDRMNSEHRDDGGDVTCDGITYDPTLCYDCHPQGNNSKCGD